MNVPLALTPGKLVELNKSGSFFSGKAGGRKSASAGQAQRKMGARQHPGLAPKEILLLTKITIY